MGHIRTAVRGFSRIPLSTLSDRDPVSSVRVESAAGSMCVDGGTLSVVSNCCPGLPIAETSLDRCGQRGLTCHLSGFNVYVNDCTTTFLAALP